MHIVLDLQACQSPESSRRGIGRYSLALAKAIAKEAGHHRVTVMLNGGLEESVEFLRGQFDGLLPPDQVTTWRALVPTAFIEPSNFFRMHASEALRAEKLRSLQPDVVHVASLFEGLADDVIATVPVKAGYASVVTLYDLIPLANKDVYLADPRVHRWYMEKVSYLHRAQTLMGISQFSCDEASQLLGISAERLTNISGAVDAVFAPLAGAQGYRTELMHRYGLHRPFVMYAGGFDSRKNIAALVRSFARLPSQLRRAHQLVIVGGAPAPERAALDALIGELGMAAGEVVFAGYVPDDDLVKLYNLCALYVFPSLQEGFGLPALEAMASGAVVIGSSTSSLPEVIAYPAALFDPRSDGSISAKMAMALTNGDFRARFREHAQQQCRRFSWRESARRAMDAFEVAAERCKQVEPARERKRETKGPDGLIAALLPAPDSELDELTHGFTIYADGDCGNVKADRPLADFRQNRDVRAVVRVLLELANHPYCAKTMGFAAKGPVDVVLRDGQLGVPLHLMMRSAEGRRLVVALLYHSGGYRALRMAAASDFTPESLDELVSPEGLARFGRCQVLHAGAGAVADTARQRVLGWRESTREVVAELVGIEGAATASDQDWIQIAAALADNLPASGRQWLVDISNLAIRDAGTGIQRVVRHVLDELVASPPPGYRVEPVRLGDDGVLRYARSYCQRRYFPNEELPPDEPVECTQGDVFLGLDLAAHLIPAHKRLFIDLRARGVKSYFVVYDLLPLLRPDCFEPHLLPLLRAWYEAIAEVADGILCISQAVADEFELWLHQSRPLRHRPLSIGWFHLGADLAPIETHSEVHPSTTEMEYLGDRATFVMVGTIEPRKGHAQALAAFEKLWQRGNQVNLLIIGKPGWLIGDLIQRLRQHPQRGSRLFWLERANDATLLAAYRNASALIMASEGEGFGLPLIEAAHHDLALIVRDLPVFREIAGAHAFYFSGHESEDLASAVSSWLALDAKGLAPHPSGMTWRTWREAAAQLVDVICTSGYVHRWMPTQLRRYSVTDYRWQTNVGKLVRGCMATDGRAGLLLYGLPIQLLAGQYIVRARGNGSGMASLEVCSAGAIIGHVRRDVAMGVVSEKGLLVELVLSLERDAEDLEIRVRVEANAKLWLSEISIHPCVAPLASCAVDA